MCPHLSQHIQYPRTRWVYADIIQAQAAVLNNAARDEEVRGRTDIPRHRNLIGRTIAAVLHRENSNTRPAALDANAETRKHLLRVIARNVWLCDCRRCICIETRKQDCRLDLRTGDRTFVVNAAQLSPYRYNNKRKVVVRISPVDTRPHLRERQKHAPHRTARQ